MKLFILTVLVFTVSGCSSYPMRTGKIVVEQFETNDYKTNNPMQVKPDVIDRISGELKKDIEKYLRADSMMTVAKDCTDGDYILSGKFEQVNSSIDSHWRVVTITVNQEFDVDVAARLKSCKTGQLIKYYDPGKGGDDMSEIIDRLGQKIVSAIRKDETVIIKD